MKVASEETIRLACTGDERAFAELVESFRRPILTHIQRMLRDSDAAEDVWQDVQFRVWRNLHRFDQARKFSTWIFTIATNTTLNEIRSRKRHNSRLVPIDELTVEAEERSIDMADESRTDDFVEEDLLADAIAALPPVQRQAFMLRDSGLAYDEIASATGEKIGTVKSRLARARATLVARCA